MIPRKQPLNEQRRYIRLDSVFPVYFQIVGSVHTSVLSKWYQGFTNNVGKSGICLSFRNPDEELRQLIQRPDVRLSMEIEMPLFPHTVRAYARVIWIKKSGKERWLAGLCYEEIDPGKNSRLLRYARTKKMLAPAMFSLMAVLAGALTFNSYMNIKLMEGNKALVHQLFSILQDSSIAKQKIKDISKEKTDLQLKIQALQVKLDSFKEQTLKQKQESRSIEELNQLIRSLEEEKALLQDQLIALSHKENQVTEELLRLDRRKMVLEKENVEKMYRWLKVHQNLRTGLVLSFEGDDDIAQWAFTYDQSLAAQAYIYFSDFQRAKKVIDFFMKKAKNRNGLFYNAYYTHDGSVAEYSVHSGPSLWMGIAAAHYVHITGDKQYLAFAEEIARSILSLQLEDPQGGIKGGPDLSWFSTEHNLDAYAFFSMLYQLTNKDLYRAAGDTILRWLTAHTYDMSGVPVKRGKGDASIATDTYAWSIAALGPQKLKDIGMNPDEIADFAEKHCVVEVQYERPSGSKVTVRGFDFAPQRHSPQGGVVSTEWSAQMVLAFKLLADYYFNQAMTAKARSYEMKAQEYLTHLARMIISSPSPSGQGESCLPYATVENTDTGHGWVTPKGKSTGSVAATTYTIFAYYNYNPLSLDNK